MYDSPPHGMQDLNLPKANQACLSCRKQKRKCNKALPACALCARMNRHCDYSEATPSPTHEDFHVLRMKLLELESRLNATNGLTGAQAPNFVAQPSSSSAAAAESAALAAAGCSAHQDEPWHALQNRFPAIAFLDSQSFKTGGCVFDIPDIPFLFGLLWLITCQVCHTQALNRDPRGKHQL
jgi:Fungal Zn(2)-Cys(6) binuclear cluster domain